MGSGSIGGYFGGMLALGGNNVTLIARGDNLKAIKRNGLKIIRDSGEMVVDCSAEEDTTKIGLVDLILLTVKTYHNSEAVPLLLPMVGTDTMVMCLQNGIDSYQDASATVGKQKVMPCAAYIEADLMAPGVVRQNGDVVRIEFGEDDGTYSERGKLVEHVFMHSGVKAEFTQYIHKTLWTKFLFIATMAGLTSLARESMASLMIRPEWSGVVQSCMEEIESVGRACGIELSTSVVIDTVDYINENVKDMHASMYTDLQNGRPLELEALTGAVVRAGITSRTSTPINNLIYAMLKPYQQGK
jgi:2-dehydropantoate 2-reductase